MKELLSEPEWLISEEGWDPLHANVQETLFTVGNGYLGTRGSLEEGHRGELSGTYLNGVYDAHASAVTDLVNVPDWLWFGVEVGGVRLDVQSCTVVEHQRVLDMRQGVLFRRTVFEDHLGRRTRLETCRFASMARRELCGLRVRITAENHSCPVSVESGIDGRRRNLDRLPAYPSGAGFHPEVRWEKWALSRHLEETGRTDADGALGLQMRTLETGITVATAAQTHYHQPPQQRRGHQGYEWIAEQAEFTLSEGETLQMDKMAVYTSSRDHQQTAQPSAEELDQAARRQLGQALAEGFEQSLARSRAAWQQMWESSDCRIGGDPEAARAVRFGIYHLLIAANGEDPTVNIGAKSLSGEGYRGHVFWDTEVFMLPFFVYTQPQTARSLLRYRHHTLPGARERSRLAGTSGARYSWESADTGKEECPEWTVDGVHRIWARDEEVHVSADVAFGIHTYLTATGDQEFLRDFGAEILFETSRFWVDRAEKSHDGGYSILQVMGPDEFHSHVDDNAFTNYLAQWHLRRAVAAYQQLAQQAPQQLAELSRRIGLEESELDRWGGVAEGLSIRRLPDGLIEQFDGYFQREDIPITAWDANDMPQYPAGYHHFNLEESMLLKQPDVVMLPFMLPDEFTEREKRANFEFYEARTLHKSSLSPAIHAIMGLTVGDSTRAMQYFRRSAFVDLHNNQGNTAEGMHIASAAGTWQILVAGFAGFRVMDGVMTFSPWLPEQWDSLSFRLSWHGSTVDVEITGDRTSFRLNAAAGETEEIKVFGEPLRLTAGETVTAAGPRQPE